MSHPSRPAVLITGSARRVGAVIARTLHQAGFNLALHYRDSHEAMTKLQHDLELARSNSTYPIHANLDDIENLPSLIEKAVAHFGRLDALVNNASTFFATPVGTITAEHWQELFASNAQAPFFLSQAAAPHLKKSQGCIINLVDIYAERPLTKHPVYCMAKAALAMMTLSLAKELGPEVRVNGVAPGAVLWPEGGKVYADQQDLIARSALQRAGTPEDVAGAVLYLLRDAKFVTGHILRVDGGRTLLI